MTQSQITLSPRIKPLADELLQLTGVNSWSNLFSLLLTRYGYHLKNSWVVSLPPASMQQPFQYELPPSVEPILHLPQTEDPVIQRLSRFIEDF